MSDVPILDDDWMDRRARLRYLDAWMEGMQAFSRRSFTEPAKDTPESLREQYASGAITFEQFERRIEQVLRP